MTKKIKISLTDFVGFVNKMGNAKLNHVKAIKERSKYEPYMDFYKMIREAIIKLHKRKQKKELLDEVLEELMDSKKKSCYPEIVAGYKKFLGRRQFEWITPPKKDWKIGNITITVNPEIGLEEKKRDGTSNFYIVKLYFKEDVLKKSQADQILTLMEMQLRSKVKEPEVKFAILDVRNSKFHVKKDHDLKELPLLEGEAHSFATIWDKL